MKPEPAKAFTDVHVLRYQGDLYFRFYSDNHLPILAAEALEQLEIACPDDLRPCTVKEIKVFVFWGWG